MKLSLRNKFLIPTVSMVLVIMLASTLFIYRTSKLNLEQSVNDQLFLIVDAIDRQLNDWLKAIKLDNQGQ